MNQSSPLPPCAICAGVNPREFATTYPSTVEEVVQPKVEHYNHWRLPEALENVTLADVCEGRRPAILARREQIKRRPPAQRKRASTPTVPSG